MVGLDTLSTLVVTAKTLYDAAQDVKENCEECTAIHQTVNSLVEVIKQSGAGLVSDSMQARLNKIIKILGEISDAITSLQKRPWFNRLLQHTRIKGKLRRARQALADATQEFQIGSNAETLVVSHEVLDHLRSIPEANKRDEARAQTFYIQFLTFSDAAMIEKLGVPENQMQEAILSLHQHIPELQDGPEKECCTRSLDAFQRRSGELPIPADQYTISGFDIEINRGRKLGSGGFANVYEGIYKEKVVAVKELHEGTHWLVIQQEVDIWRRLKHEHILKFIGACPVAERPFMVCELKPNGDVLSYLRKNPNASRRKILYEASLGLKYLHENSVVHGDLKANNILIDENGTACLSDFGLSRIKSQTTTIVGPASGTEPQQGTARWMAPEHLSGGTASKRSDVYSFAMTIYEVFSGRPPFPDLPTNMLFVVVCEKGRRPEWSDGIRERGLDEPMWRVITACWQQNARERISAVELADRLQYLVAQDPAATSQVSPQLQHALSDSAVPQLKHATFLRPQLAEPGPYTAPIHHTSLPQTEDDHKHPPAPQRRLPDIPSNAYPASITSDQSTLKNSSRSSETMVDALPSDLLFPPSLGSTFLPSPQSSSPETIGDIPESTDLTVSDVSASRYEDHGRTVTLIADAQGLASSSSDSFPAVSEERDPAGPLTRLLSPAPLLLWDAALESHPVHEDPRARLQSSSQASESVQGSRLLHRHRRTVYDMLSPLDLRPTAGHLAGMMSDSELLSLGSDTRTPPLSPVTHEQTARPRLRASGRPLANRPVSGIPSDDFVLRRSQYRDTLHPDLQGVAWSASLESITSESSTTSAPFSPQEVLTPQETVAYQPQLVQSPPQALPAALSLSRPSYFPVTTSFIQSDAKAGAATSPFPESSSTSSTSSPVSEPEDLPELPSPRPKPSAIDEVVQGNRPSLERRNAESTIPLQRASNPPLWTPASDLETPELTPDKFGRHATWV